MGTEPLPITKDSAALSAINVVETPASKRLLAVILPWKRGLVSVHTASKDFFPLAIPFIISTAVDE